MRAFLAFPISEATRKKIRLFSEEFSAIIRGKWSPVPVQNIHLTTHFFPDLTEEGVKKIVESVPEPLSRFEPFSFSISSFGVFPDFSHPRVLWLGVNEGKETILHIKKTLDEVLNHLNLHYDAKEFHPHITFGRVKGGKIQREKIPPWEEVKETISVVTLQESQLKPDGAIYRVLAEFPLGGEKR
ncbi:MAG: RNA 2',3'-cyclic phosphodiesterase [bacterium JZ-2024 1]